MMMMNILFFFLNIESGQGLELRFSIFFTKFFVELLFNHDFEQGHLWACQSLEQALLSSTKNDDEDDDNNNTCTTRLK